MTQKIVMSFPYKGITNTQTLTLSNQLNTLLSDGLPKDNPFIQDVMEDISLSIGNLERALGRVTKSEYTDDKEELDDKRDDLYIGFTKQIKSNLRHFDEASRSAAAFLLDIISRREPSLQRLSYAENTAELDLLFTDMDNEEAQQALAQLMLVPWYEELKRINKKFKATIQEQVNVEGSDDTPLLKATKQDLFFFFKVLFAKIAYYAKKEQDPYPAIMEKIYDLVTDIKAVAEVRETRKESSAEETPASE